jgi:hypothetical protein
MDLHAFRGISDTSDTSDISGIGRIIGGILRCAVRRAAIGTVLATIGSLATAGPLSPQQPTWTTHVLDTAFRSEGVAVADVDHDLDLDVLAGEYVYRAPSWTRHEIAPPGTYDPVNGYSDCFVAGAGDVDGDGWEDFLSVGFPGGEARWFKNPAGAASHWQRHVITRSASNESPTFNDVDGDGRVDLVMGLHPRRRVVWLEPGPVPTHPWVVHSISVPGQPGFQQFDHGLGLADVDGDGRRDVLTPDGFYAAPLDRRASPWPFHAASWRGSSPFGPQGAAQMHAQDVDGDGDRDVFTSSPHAYGVWWWEQTPAGAWIEHPISNAFSQSHALELHDIDGDGLRDVITGKRWYAHGPSGDPGSQEPAVLVWFRPSIGPSGVTFERQLIHGDSGVGTQFVVRDLDGDGDADVVTSNKKGVFVHLQQ